MSRGKDFTQVAHAVAMAATGQGPELRTDAQLNARKGGQRGGKARMESMTEAQRKALSAKAVAARKKAPSTKPGAASKG